MRWYRFSIQEEKDPAEEPEPTVEAPQEAPPENVVQPKNRSEERRDLKNLFRQVNLKSPEIIKTIDKAPQAVYPLIQGIDATIERQGPAAIDRLKGTLQKTDFLPMQTPHQMRQREVAKPPAGRQQQPKVVP